MAARVVLVVASAHDTVASAFVRRYARQGVRLLQPRDLSTPGWRYELGARAGPSRVAVAGRQCSDEHLAGVITRLASVTPSDLPHIDPGDRAYVAVEMTAFLVAWLERLSCPVLNRPTPVCLAGEWYSPQTWVHRAHRLGIPVANREWSAVRGLRAKVADPLVAGGGSTTSVTVVASKAIGRAAACVMQYARTLVRAAELDLATVSFSSPDNDARFLDLSLWTDLADPTIAAAVMRQVMRPCQSIRTEAV